jgi:hypothetical protein
MLASGAIVMRDGRLHAVANHNPVQADTLRVPSPSNWPASKPN